MKAKIRGIYSTALTKLLLENGNFEIVQEKVKETTESLKKTENQ